jgi:hypothetical protein
MVATSHGTVKNGAAAIPIHRGVKTLRWYSETMASERCRTTARGRTLRNGRDSP